QNAGNLAGYNDVIGNQVIQNAVRNLKVQNVGNLNGLMGVQGNGNQNQIGNGKCCDDPLRKEDRYILIMAYHQSIFKKA
nr:hypothetical protein [Tanacetum cinerariifolium]